MQIIFIFHNIHHTDKHANSYCKAHFPLSCPSHILHAVIHSLSKIRAKSIYIIYNVHKVMTFPPQQWPQCCPHPNGNSNVVTFFRALHPQRLVAVGPTRIGGGGSFFTKTEKL